MGYRWLGASDWGTSGEGKAMSLEPTRHKLKAHGMSYTLTTAKVDYSLGAPQFSLRMLRFRHAAAIARKDLLIRRSKWQLHAL